MNNINQSVSSVAGGFKVGDRVRINLECATGKIIRLDLFTPTNGPKHYIAYVQLPGKHPSHYALSMLKAVSHE